jgi:hypothetical protein
MTWWIFPLHQPATTVAKPTRRRSARLAPEAPLRATPPIAPPTPARRRRLPASLLFSAARPQTLPSRGKL